MFAIFVKVLALLISIAIIVTPFYFGFLIGRYYGIKKGRSEKAIAAAECGEYLILIHKKEIEHGVQ